MAKTKFDIKTEATKPLLAGVGVTDLAVEVVRDFVSETQTRLAGVQKDVTARVADVQKTVANPKALRVQAVTAVNARVDALTTDAKARRKAIEARVTELQAEAKAYPAKVQTLVDDNVTSLTSLTSQATDTYSDLVKRGESLIGRIRRQESTKATVKSAKTTVSKAKATTTQAKKATTTATTQAKTAAKPAVKKAAATKSSAKATVTAAEKTASNAVKAVADAAEKLGD